MGIDVGLHELTYTYIIYELNMWINLCLMGIMSLRTGRLMSR